MSAQRRFFLVVLVCFVMLAQINAAPRSVVLRAKVASGTNRFLGQPLSDFGAPLGTVGFSNVGLFNPSGGLPLPLTSGSSEMSLLATLVDPEFLALFGKTLSDVDRSKLNVPLRDVHVNADLAGGIRVKTTGILEAQQTQASQAEPSESITLREWMRARGEARIVCKQRSDSIRLSFAGLLPNRLYTAWAILGGDSVMPIPLGGLPNVIVSDAEGNATFERELNFCPFETASGHRPLLVIDIVFHSDQQTNGLVPELDLAGFFTGTTTHTQLEFLVKGTPLQ